MEEDIATKKGSVDNYGIMGLGYQPGNACIVSAFRLRNGAADKKLRTTLAFRIAPIKTVSWSMQKVK